MFPHARSGIAALLLALSVLPLARAQVFDLEQSRVQMAELKGLWRFHTGDDPDGKLGWVDSGFDDSSWKLLHSDQPWNQQGYPGYSGMAWYRFQVVLPANQKPLALYIPNIHTSYKVFADGRLIGQFGGLPPREKVVESFGVGTQTLIPLPSDLTSRGGSLTIAIRVWEWPGWSVSLSNGGPWYAVRIGDAGLLDEWRTLQIRSTFWSAFAGNVLLFGCRRPCRAGTTRQLPGN